MKEDIHMTCYWQPPSHQKYFDELDMPQLKSHLDNNDPMDIWYSYQIQTSYSTLLCIDIELVI
jgi:hypothetical protein